MAYEVVMSYHLHMPSYFLGTFTEYPIRVCVLLFFCPKQQQSAQLLALFALNASAYIRICFTIESNPLLRVGERCSFNPILSIK